MNLSQISYALKGISASQYEPSLASPQYVGLPKGACTYLGSSLPIGLLGKPSPLGEQNRLLKSVLTVHAGALVYVSLGYVGAAAGGDALLDALADEAAHEEGAALDAPVGLRVPGDPLRLRHRALLSDVSFMPVFYRLGLYEKSEGRNNGRLQAPLEYTRHPLLLGRKVLERAAALYAEKITRFYKSSGRGISNVSLEVRPGEVFGLVGPNGSGKSTLLRVLSTAIAPESGTFRVGGTDGLKERRKVRSRMGLMMDRPTHYGDLSGWANAYFFACAYGMEEGKANGVLAELFDYFGLAEYKDDKVKTYSYGMGKKLALVEAMAHGPEVLLLDEPSLGLDYTSQLAYQKKIRELASAGVAVLVASNQVDEVEALCERVAFLYKGKLVAVGVPEK